MICLRCRLEWNAGSKYESCPNCSGFKERVFKEGDLIRCRKNEWFRDKITVGKTYRVREVREGGMPVNKKKPQFVIITNDRGEKDVFASTFFDPVFDQTPPPGGNVA